MKADEAQARVLVVDDDLSMREFLTILLQRDGYTVEAVATGEAALAAAERRWPDLVLTDLNMPGMSGMELLAELKTRAVRRGADLEVVMVTAYGTTESAIEAMRRGAADYVLKPFSNDDLRLIVRRALRRRLIEAENERLKGSLQGELHFGRLIGSSPIMRRVYELIRRVKDTPIHCLVLGESGTGKELVARSIHEQGLRGGEFVAVNCGAIPENLVESELFGHVKGSFTGASRDKQGLIAASHRGTLFLDEVNSLPHPAQVKLLRVLQERRVLPVGALKETEVDLRVVSASNADLEAEVRAGRFREDLYYRINVVQIPLPPLRERLDDLPELVRHFVTGCAREYGKPVKGATPAAVASLRAWEWPGNVRELQNTIARAVALCEGPMIDVDDLPEKIQLRRLTAGGGGPAVSAGAAFPTGDPESFPEEGVDLDALMAETERRWLLGALDAAAGNKTHAARLLQLSFRSFRYRLAKHGMDTP